MSENIPSENSVSYDDPTKGYMVLEEEAPGDLENVVDLHLAKGWELVGGVAVAIGSYEGRDGQKNYHRYCQAMVKR